MVDILDCLAKAGFHNCMFGSIQGRMACPAAHGILVSKRGKVIIDGQVLAEQVYFLANGNLLPNRVNQEPARSGGEFGEI